MILIVILQLTLVVFVHELGHYIFARLSGVQVLSFNIGFGPVVWSRERGGTEYTLRLIPLGGYVRLAGLDESARKVPKAQTYQGQSVFRRFEITVGGALANILFAWLIFYGFLVWREGIFLTGIYKSFYVLLGMLLDIVRSIRALFTGLTGLSGPVGIVAASVLAARNGAVPFLLFTALLSANLGIFNLLPFPALDGGRLIFLLYELLFRRKPNPALERWVHALGFLILFGLIVLVSIQDLIKL